MRAETARIETDVPAIGAVTLSVPITYKSRQSPVIPPTGGALCWAEGHVWAWEDEAFGVERAPSTSPAALALWVGDTQGYPTIAAPYGTVMSARTECRRELDGGTVYVTCFVLSYAQTAPRYFVVANWLKGSEGRLKAVFHAPTPESQGDGIAIVHSLVFDAAT